MSNNTIASTIFCVGKTLHRENIRAIHFFLICLRKDQSVSSKCEIQSNELR
jgi:hypothetical protein